MDNVHDLLMNIFVERKTCLIQQSTLKKITECVVQLDTADSATIKSFFKWVSASISTSSMKVEDGFGEVTGLSELPPPPAEVNIVV